MIYTTNGFLSVQDVDGSTFTGRYSVDNKLNVFNATGSTTVLGKTHPCGAMNVTIVDGTSFTGLYAANGSINVVNDPSSLLGVYHPCGAFNVSGADTFSPSDLFASSEDGVFYDPSDLTSLYQETDGGDTGAIGSVVGLMLDKRLMGGLTAGAFIAAQPELITNGGFDTDTDWTKGGSWSIGSGVASVAASGAETLTQNGVLTVGDMVEITFTISNYTTGTLRTLAGGSSASGYYSANGTYSVILEVIGDTKLYFQTGATGTMDIDNVSVKAVPGNHAVAPSDAGRPKLLTTALDTASGDGTELVTNGTFDTDVAGWTNRYGDGSTTWQAGRARVTNGVTNDYNSMYQALTTEAGKTYALSGDFITGTTTSGRLSIGTSVGAADLGAENFSASDSFQTVFTAAGTTTYVTCQTNTTANSVYVEWDNISVQEVQASDLLYYLEFDGVDDQFIHGISGKMAVAVAARAANEATFIGLFATGDIAPAGTMLLVNVAANNQWGTYGGGNMLADSQGDDDSDHIFVMDTPTSGTFYLDGAADGTYSATEGQTDGHLGGSATQIVDGRIYCAVALDRAFTAEERASLEAWMATKSGVTL